VGDGSVCAINHGGQIPHSSVNINILDCGEEWAVGRNVDPTVYLPAQVKNDEERSSEIGLEEGFWVQVGSSDGVQGDVELAHKAEYVDENAQV